MSVGDNYRIWWHNCQMVQEICNCVPKPFFPENETDYICINFYRIFSVKNLVCDNILKYSILVCKSHNWWHICFTINCNWILTSCPRNSWHAAVFQFARKCIYASEHILNLKNIKFDKMQSVWRFWKMWLLI